MNRPIGTSRLISCGLALICLAALLLSISVAFDSIKWQQAISLLQHPTPIIDARDLAMLMKNRQGRRATLADQLAAENGLYYDGEYRLVQVLPESHVRAGNPEDKCDLAKGDLIVLHYLDPAAGQTTERSFALLPTSLVRVVDCRFTDLGVIMHVRLLTNSLSLPEERRRLFIPWESSNFPPHAWSDHFLLPSKSNID